MFIELFPLLLSDLGKGAGICFICTWADSECRLNDFPDSYKHWESPCFKFRNWQNGHQLGVPYKLASSSLIQPRKSGRVTRVSPDFESDERIRRLFDLPGDLFNVSYPDSIVQLIHYRENTLGHISAAIPAVPVAQYPATTSLAPSAENRSNSEEHHSSLSSSYGFPRMPRKRYCPEVGRNEAQTSIPITKDERGLKRLRKTYQDYHPRRVNRDVGLLNRNVTQIPNAMSEKVCKVARRCERLLHKNYNFIEESVCASSGGFVPGLAGNRESTNSGSSNDDPGFENASSEDISSGGPPSPVPNLNAAHVPLGREAVRGNDFSNTVFIDDSLPSDDNISVSRNDFLPPGQREPTSNNGEKVTQPPLPTESMLDCDIMMGSGSTNPCPENENVRVCRPASSPQSDPGTSRPSLVSPSLVHPINELDYDNLFKTMTENYNQFLISATQLNDAQKQRASESGVDAGMRQEITRLERKNSELSAAMRMLTEQLAGVRQELADSKSRELQLQLSLEEIGGVLPDSWEHLHLLEHSKVLAGVSHRVLV